MPRFIASHQTGQRNFNALPMDATSQESLHTFIERIRHCKHCHIPTALGLAFDAFPKAIYEVSQHRAAQQLRESTTDLPRVDIAGNLAHASTPCTTHMQTPSPPVFNSKRGVRKHRASQLQQSTGLVGQRSSPHFYRTPRLKELPHPPSLSLGFPAGCFLHGHHPPSRQRGPQFPSSLKPHGPASLKEEEKSRITVTATYEGNLVDAQHSPGWSSICLTSRSSTEFDKLEVRSGSWLSTAPRRSMSCLNSRFALPCACLHADSESSSEHPSHPAQCIGATGTLSARVSVSTLAVTRPATCHSKTSTR